MKSLVTVFLRPRLEGGSWGRGRRAWMNARWHLDQVMASMAAMGRGRNYIRAELLRNLEVRDGHQVWWAV